MSYKLEENLGISKRGYQSFNKLLWLLDVDKSFAMLYADYLIAQGVELTGRRKNNKLLMKMNKKLRAKFLEIFELRKEANEMLKTKLDVFQLQNLILERLKEV